MLAETIAIVGALLLFAGSIMMWRWTNKHADVPKPKHRGRPAPVKPFPTRGDLRPVSHHVRPR